MTVDKVTSSWFDPLPLQDYQQLVQNSVPQNVTECPPDKVVGTPAIEVACGPNLRFLGCLENGSYNYRGSVLLVIRDKEGDETTPYIKYLIGPSSQQFGSAPNAISGEFPATLIHKEQGLSFWRYAIELNLQPYEQKVKYSINDEFNANFQFFVPSVEQSMNIMSYSCNGFSLGVDTSNFKGSLWYDVLRKHENLHYHVMLGGGDQIYCDSIKKSSKPFEHWLKHKRLNSRQKLTPEMGASFEEYYMNQYLQWFGKGYWQGSEGKTLQCMYPIALQQIPQINIFDDHDIIDGFGSYGDSTMAQDIFQAVGNYAFKYYMLFQHHTSPDENPKSEPSFISGNKPGPYIKQVSRSVYARLGKEIGLVGFDCRTERTKKQVITADTYRSIFTRLKQEITNSNGEIKHLLVMLGVPICYPRMVWAESIMSSRLLAPVKFLARKGIVAKGLVNEFDGSIELLDDLNDHWCAIHHKHERNKLMSDLVHLASQNDVRITILSGDVHLGALSRLKTKTHRHQLTKTGSKAEENVDILSHPEYDPRLIFNVISSAIVNTPPPNGMASLLQKRSKIHHFDKNTDEDVVNLFQRDTDDSKRSNELFLNKRNYSDLILFKNLSAASKKKYAEFQPGDLIYPGPSKHLKKCVIEDVNTFKSEETGYPLDNDSLVTTFHFEVDMENTDSMSYDYEVLIPKFAGK